MAWISCFLYLLIYFDMHRDFFHLVRFELLRWSSTLSGDPLIFTASVQAQVIDPTVSIRLTMVCCSCWRISFFDFRFCEGVLFFIHLTGLQEGIWYRAFGIPKLAIGDIIGEVAIMAREPWLAAIELGGSLYIGETTDPERITGKIYFRIDVQNPANNYFFGSVSRLTIGSVLRVR